MKLLYAEDDPSLAAFTAEGLRAGGFTVDLVPDGRDALNLLSTRSYDAALLDIMLPGRDGLSILKLLRQRGNPLPVLLLTARGELEERIEGLNLGADDYLPKPYHLEELIARLNSVWRRSTGTGLSLLSVADLTLNLMTREAGRGDRRIALTSQEFALLAFLMKTPGRIRTRPEILEHVWDYRFNPGSNLVDVYIRRLRSQVDQPGEAPLIQTVRGAGYRIQSPAS